MMTLGQDGGRYQTASRKQRLHHEDLEPALQDHYAQTPRMLAAAAHQRLQIADCRGGRDSDSRLHRPRAALAGKNNKSLDDILDQQKRISTNARQRNKAKAAEVKLGVCNWIKVRYKFQPKWPFKRPCSRSPGMTCSKLTWNNVVLTLSGIFLSRNYRIVSSRRTKLA